PEGIAVGLMSARSAEHRSPPPDVSDWKTRPRPSPLRAVGMGVSASVLIARHVGVLDDAEQSASRVLKHNEVVSRTILHGYRRAPKATNRPTSACWSAV